MKNILIISSYQLSAYYISLLFICIVLISKSQCAFPTSSGSNTSSEHRLYRHLIKQSDYLRTMRPVRNHSRAISVKLGMCVMMLEDVVERDQTMLMSVCIKMKWVDEFLRWDPRKFDGLQWMAVPVTDIWQPDIALVNSAEPYALTRKPAQADITADGSVGYYPAGRMSTKCSLDITYFPMDYQRCEVRFESWVYPLQAIDIEEWDGEASVDIKDVYPNHLWTLSSYYVIRDAIQYDDLKFARLKFVFELKRKPLYFFMYIILPLLLLSALQTLGHSLPVEHPGRMAMLTALFIGSSVTQSSIAAHVPKTSEVVSLIQIYSTIVNVTLFVSMVISFIMLYTLLRLPPKEPGFWILMQNFVSITWSTRSCRKIEMPTSHSLTGRDHHPTTFGDSGVKFRGGSASGFWGLEQAHSEGNIDGMSMRQRSLMPGSAKPSVYDGHPSAPNVALLSVQVNSGDSGYSTHPRRPTSIATRQNSVMPNWVRAMYSGEYTSNSQRKIANQLSTPPTERTNAGPPPGKDANSASATPVSGTAQHTGGAAEAFVAIDMSNSDHADGNVPPHSANGLLAPVMSRKASPVAGFKTEAERRKMEAENAERHKKRWLIYCVALDKSIMYAVTVWNIFVPIILFISIPRIQSWDSVPPGVERIQLDI